MATLTNPGTQQGTEQDDLFVSSTANDTMFGSGGTDTASFRHLGPANDLGDDVVFNADFVTGRRVEIVLGEGNNAGSMTVSTTVSQPNAPAGIQEQDTLFSIENVIGSNGTEKIVGNSGANRLEGLGGHDTIFAGGGTDTVLAGSGRDLVDGGLGSDILDGGSGNDTLTLESFNGIFSPAVFRHTVDLEQGFMSRTSALTVTDAFIEQERDTLSNFENVIGSSRDDRIFGTSGNNVLEGKFGNDFLEGRGGADTQFGSFTLPAGDTIDGGEGTDTVSYAHLDRFEFMSVSVRSTITLANGTADGSGLVEMASQIAPQFVTLTDDTLRNVENVFASNISDTINGNSAGNVIDARNGNDLIRAGGGVDDVRGGAGSDTIDGGSGSDVLAGGTGVDTLDMSSWNTQFAPLGTTFTGAEVRLGEASPLTIVPIDNDFSFAVDTATLEGTRFGAAVVVEQDTLSGFENVIGTSRADTIGGNSQSNRLEGRDGNDLIKGFGGADVIVGGGGQDTMVGGSGGDVFVFQAETDSTFGARDRIVDFTVGQDRIDLSAIDANTLINGNQAFTFIGTGAFTGAGQIRAVINGADNVTLLANTDGDLIAEMAITVTGSITNDLFGGVNILAASASDFML